MPAYFIAHNRIIDADKMQQYIPKAFASLLPHQPEFLVFDEHSKAIDGSLHLPRTIVIRFASRADAEAWYHSPAYREVLPLRLQATEGFAMIVDGYEPAAA